MVSPVVAIALLACGACAGSFAATAGLRLARGEQSLFGRSRCDGCGIGLSYWRTLPVVSFAHARGACAACGGPIDPAHVAGEIAGIAIAAAALATASPLIAVMGFALLTTAVVDWKTRRLPDVFTLVIAICAAALAALRSLETLEVGLVAAAITFTILAALRQLLPEGGRAARDQSRGRGARAQGGQSLGFGDVKLLTALALWLGAATPWAISVAALAALMASRISPPQDGRIPFGPAIAAACFGVGVWHDLGGLAWLS